MVALNEEQAAVMDVLAAKAQEMEAAKRTYANRVAAYKAQAYTEEFAAVEREVEDLVAQLVTDLAVPKRQVKLTLNTTYPDMVDKILERTGGYVKTGRY